MDYLIAPKLNVLITFSLTVRVFLLHIGKYHYLLFIIKVIKKYVFFLIGKKLWNKKNIKLSQLNLIFISLSEGGLKKRNVK